MTETTLVEAIVLGVTGAALGPALARFSSKRAAAQPLALAPEAEEIVLAEVLARPKAFAVVAELRPEELAVVAHQRIWSAIQTAGGGVLDGAIAADESELDALEAKIPNDLWDGIFDQLESEDAEVLEGLRGREGAGSLSVKELLKAGELVLAAYDDRTSLAGAVPAVPGGVGEAPFVRRVRDSSILRKIIVGFMSGLFLALSPWLVEHMGLHSNLGDALALVALVALSLTAIEIAIVDYDTFYVDYPVLAFGGGGAWVFTVLSALATHRPAALLAGLIALVVFGFFEVVNFFYKRIRHCHGMGFGDSVLLLVAIGVPAALTGSPRLGWYAMIVALLAAVAVRLIGMIARRVNSSSPFALAPYLALGWMIAWVLLILSGA